MKSSRNTRPHGIRNSHLNVRYADNRSLEERIDEDMEFLSELKEYRKEALCLCLMDLLDHHCYLNVSDKQKTRQDFLHKLTVINSLYEKD